MYEVYEIKSKNNFKYQLQYSITNIGEILIIKIKFPKITLEYEIMKEIKKSINEFIKNKIETEKKNSKLFIIKYYNKQHVKKLVVNMGFLNDKGGALSSYILSNINFNLLYFGNYGGDYYQELIENKITTADFCVEYIKYFCKKHNILTKNILLTGESVGGYGSIYASLFLKNSICVAFNPGLYNFKGTKFMETNKKLPNFIDKIPNNIYEMLKNNNNTSTIYIFLSYMDVGIDNIIYYDLFQTGTLAHYKNVHIIISKCNIHPFFYCYKFYKFVDFINNFYAKENINNINSNTFSNTIIKYFTK